MTNELKEIAKLKKLCEHEIVWLLTILSQLESIEKIERTTGKIKSAFRAVNKAENKRSVRKSRQVVK